MFRNKTFLKIIAAVDAGLVLAILLFWAGAGSVWTRWDHQALDAFLRKAVAEDKGAVLAADGFLALRALARRRHDR